MTSEAEPVRNKLTALSSRIFVLSQCKCYALFCKRNHVMAQLIKKLQIGVEEFSEQLFSLMFTKSVGAIAHPVVKSINWSKFMATHSF